MGDTVNVASRLGHAAPVGAVLVSHDTYRHVRGVFDVEGSRTAADTGKVGNGADLCRAPRQAGGVSDFRAEALTTWRLRPSGELPS